jgi:aspartyl-tRNA(Asn)/glutamyl-tRNA(Gln) amidotransferase subunit C
MLLMPAISRDEVAHLAGLARIEMSDEELDRMAGQLDVILGAVAQVREVAGDDVPATSHPMPLVNVTRPDEPRPGLSAEQALAGAPAQQEQRFRVPRILEED